MGSTRPVDSDSHVDDVVLGLLVRDDLTHIWAIDEMIREIGDRLDAVDSLDRLIGAGLAHRVGDGFVIASRAARYTDRLHDGD